MRDEVLRAVLNLFQVVVPLGTAAVISRVPHNRWVGYAGGVFGGAVIAVIVHAANLVLWNGLRGADF